MDLPSKDYFLKTLDRPHYAGRGQRRLSALGSTRWRARSGAAAEAPAAGAQRRRRELSLKGDSLAIPESLGHVVRWSSSQERSNILQINATVAAGGVLLLCAAFVMSRILPGLLWAFVLAIALWPTFLKVRAWGVSRRLAARLGAPLLLTLLIAVLVAAPVAFAAVEMVRESESFMGWINDARAHGIALPPAAADIPWVGGCCPPGGRTIWRPRMRRRVFFGGLGSRNLLGLTRNLGPECCTGPCCSASPC